MNPSFACLFAVVLLPAFGDTGADIERALSIGKRFENTVFRSAVEPHWLPGGTNFWYRVQTGPQAFETVGVDAVSGTRTPGFVLPPAEAAPNEDDQPQASGEGGVETVVTVENHTAAPLRLFWLDSRGRRKDYGEIAPGQRHLQHTYEGHVWLVANASGQPLGAVQAKDDGARMVVDDSWKPRAEKSMATRKRGVPASAAHGEYKVFVRDFNVWLETKSGAQSRRLSEDGVKGDAYRDPVYWSPDGTRFAAFRVKEVEVRKVTVVEALPKDQVQPKLHTYDYPKPGDALPKPQLKIFSVVDGKQISVPDDLFPNPFTQSGELDLRWADNGRELFLDYNQRGHQLYRILGVDALSGTVRTVVEEAPKTFVDYTNKTWRHWLDASGELIWMCERDGWNHLYRIDVASGKVKNQITRGSWVVRKIERVDEEKRQIWFFASGVRPEQDPYYLQLCRVNLDGSDFLVLTDGDGTHTVQFSPDLRWFIDTWSRVDQPPESVLRRSEDGGLVCALERADARALLASGWRPPQRFSAKGRDGTTDIFGILVLPLDFDPAKKYPVLENIYAGPQSSYVPKAFGRQSGLRQMAELGFVLVQIDGMGTNDRSKAFHDVCWKNLGDAGFPDRIAWLRAAAATRPWMDLSRVGIYGGSAGGQNALGALLFHGDFYKAAAADCGCHDNRMDKIWWNEQWMGWPIGPHYAEQSNVTQAHRLQGKLLLTVGELDTNVDPASTYQVAAALTQAGKECDLLVLPGANHGAGESRVARIRRAEFFLRHLGPEQK